MQLEVPTLEEIVAFFHDKAKLNVSSNMDANELLGEVFKSLRVRERFATSRISVEVVRGEDAAGGHVEECETDKGVTGVRLESDCVALEEVSTANSCAFNQTSIPFVRRCAHLVSIATNTWRNTSGYARTPRSGRSTRKTVLNRVTRIAKATCQVCKI